MKDAPPDNLMPLGGSKVEFELLYNNLKPNRFMSKTTCNVKLYKMRLVSTAPLIFGGSTYSDEWEAPCNAIMDDYHEKVAFQFIHPKDNGKKYSRHYERPAYSGLAELRVGRFRTANDYAVVIINIATETYEPYLVLEDYKPAFSNADILAEIVARAFDWVLRGKMLKLVLEPWEPAKDEKIYWIKDCRETYRICRKAQGDDAMQCFGFEQLKKSRSKKLATGMKEYIKEGLEDKVDCWIRKEIKGMTEPIDMMRPMRAFMEFEMFKKKPPFKVFTAHYHKEGMIEISSYNGYMYTKNNKYNEDLAYDDTKKRIMKDFGIE